MHEWRAIGSIEPVEIMETTEDHVTSPTAPYIRPCPVWSLAEAIRAAMRRLEWVGVLLELLKGG